ncbi:MAG: hypothetical protein AAGF28_07055 [Pseudomonadota bacterium]
MRILLAFAMLLASSYSAWSFGRVTYSELKADGFVTSRLTENRAGVGGWIVSKGDRKYFCRMRGGFMRNFAAARAGNPSPDQVRRCSKVRN